MALRDFARTIEKLDLLDPLADTLAGAAATVTGDRRIKNLLSGRWLGHPLHPVLTDLPIGLFSAATLTDLLGGRWGADAADALTIAGLGAVVPTTLSGWSDWADTVGQERRVGLVHALANTGAAALYAGALLSRRAGARRTATVFSLLGAGSLTMGGYLGGHLVFSRGIGVDHGVFDEPPSDWTRVAREADLPEGSPVLASASGYGILLYRREGEIFAIADRCNHAGGPLHEGEVDEALCVTCPWHASRFRLDDGAVLDGPATNPQATFDVRVVEGNVEVRLAPF